MNKNEKVKEKGDKKIYVKYICIYILYIECD